MPEWCYVGTAPASRANDVKKRLRRKGIGFTTKSHPGEIGDGIYGPGVDFYVGKSRYFEAETYFTRWEEEGTVVIITTAVAAGL